MGAVLLLTNKTFYAIIYNDKEGIMKKLLTILLLPLMAAAYSTEKVGSITWKYTLANGVATVGSGGEDAAIATSIAGAITIPSTLGGCPVTSIGANAFAYCKQLTAVTIPNSVTNIGECAFIDCNKLVTADIPAGVKNIGANAFGFCYKLSSLTIPAGVKVISAYAFERCLALTSITIPEGVTTIAQYAFDSCSGATTLSLPSTLKVIGDSAFAGCEKLKTLTIPEGVTEVGTDAFDSCSGLTSVQLPSTLTYLSAGMFFYCSNLTTINIPPNVSNIYGETFSYCEALETITIPASVKNIYSESFSHCINLTNFVVDANSKSFKSVNGLLCDKSGEWIVAGVNGDVVIPEGVYGILENAFYGLCNLTSLTIPRSLEVISNYGTFEECYALKTIYVQAGDAERVSELYSWDNVNIVECMPTIEGDSSAKVEGNFTDGYTITPSASVMNVVLNLQGIDASKVTVVVAPTIQSITAQGANIQFMSGGYNITSLLDIPATLPATIDVTQIKVKESIIKEVLSPAAGAVINLKPDAPSIITAPTRLGLTYTLYEGRALNSMQKGASTPGTGNAWQPTLSVTGGTRAFYYITVTK